MSDKIFLDTNILVYAHDKDADEKHRISFWDALVMVAAYEAKCEKILTEDMNSGQIIEGVLIENPFKAQRK